MKQQYRNGYPTIVLCGLLLAGISFLAWFTLDIHEAVQPKLGEPTASMEIEFVVPQRPEFAEKKDAATFGSENDENQDGVEADDETVGPIAFGATTHGEPRSPQWPGVRNKFAAEHPLCECCGAKTQEIHHKHPFHLKPELELDPDNLIALCKRCHLLIGHLGNFQNYNPDVVKHVKIIHDAKAKADAERKAAKQFSKTTVAP